tara:strand:- start:987 stop:2075 length:1089 start_codon:yes stop_codon:yes gene_type:complete
MNPSMNNIREYISSLVLIMRNNFAWSFITTFILGVVLGWIVLGWWLFPVRWTDAHPGTLHPDFRNQWVQMTADSFVLTTDIDTASDRLSWLGEQSDEYLEFARSYVDGPQQLRIAQLSAALTSVENTVNKDTELVEAYADSKSLSESENSLILSVLGGIFVVVCMGGIGFFVVKNVMNRNLERNDSNIVIERVNGIASDENSIDQIDHINLEESNSFGNEEPLSRYMTTFLLGDDLYDDSFGIDDANGDFLGECGMGISDVIGVGEPKKVCAFEVWLFDKNDVRTVTKVLMSEDAFGDDSKRALLAPKGEPVRVESGGSMVLETACLIVNARIVDMQYGSGALPEKSFFSQMTLEITAWKKD